MERSILLLVRLIPLAALWIIPVAYTAWAYNAERPKAILADILAVFFVLTYLALPGKRRIQIAPPRELVLPLLLIVFATLLSLTGAIHLKAGLAGCREVFRNAVFLLAFASLGRNRRWSFYVFLCLLFSGTFVSVIGLLQKLGVSPLGPYCGGHWTSTLGNINYSGQFLLVSAAPGCIWLWCALGKRKRFWVIPFASISLTYLLMCRCRGAWLGFLCAATCVAGLTLWKTRNTLAGKKFARIALSIAFLLLVVGLLPRVQGKGYEPNIKYFLTAFSPSGAKTNQVRLAIWHDAGRMIRENLLTGVGMNNVEHVYPLFRSERERQLSGPDTTVDHVHNDFLQFAAEGGLFVVMGYVWLIAIVLASFRYKGVSRSQSGMRLACIIGILATLVHSQFSSNLYRPASALCFWALCGLALALNQSHVKLSPSDSPKNHRLWFLFPALLISARLLMEGVGERWLREADLSLRHQVNGRAAEYGEKAARWVTLPEKAWFLAGQGRFREGRYDLCRRDYLESLKFAPNLENSHLNVFLCGNATKDQALASEARRRAEFLLGEERVRARLSE